MLRPLNEVSASLKKPPPVEEGAFLDDEAGEAVILPPVRADGRAATPRAPMAMRDGEIDLNAADAEDLARVGPAPTPPAAVAEALAAKRIVETGGQDMQAYANLQDGEVQPRQVFVAASTPGKTQQQLEAVSGFDADLKIIQDNRFKRAKQLLVGATIEDVNIDFDAGTVVDLVVKLDGGEGTNRVVIQVLETGQIFLRVAK